MKRCGAALVLALLFFTAAGPGFAAGATCTGESLMNDVVTYAEMGEHRTATEADRKTTQWLSDRLTKAGFTVERMPFTVPQFFPSSTSLQVGGKAYEAFPLWPARATKAPVTGTLAWYDPADPSSVKGKIAVCSVPVGMGWALNKAGGKGDPAPVDYLRKLTHSGAVGAIYVVRSPTGEILAMNVPVSVAPWPIPIILARYGDLPALKAACAQGETAAFSIEGTFEERAVSSNLVARCGSGGRLIVVTSPLTGWFRCAGERGTGIAVFLALAESIGRRRPAGVSYLFVGTNAHELGYYGQQVFLRKFDLKPKDVTLWLHLGAGIATWSGIPGHAPKYDLPGVDVADVKHLRCSPQFVPILGKNFAGVFGYAVNSGRLEGELRHLIQGGYPAFGLYGTLNAFHTRSDTPDNTAPQLLEPITRAVIRSVVDIEKMP